MEEGFASTFDDSIASPMEEVVAVPDCSPDLKPVVGQKFKSLEFGFAYYDVYARAVGFDTRKSQLTKIDGVITWYNIVCNRDISVIYRALLPQLQTLYMYN